jgi:ABC-type phosphate transport system substrate-binding protein
MKAMKTKFLGVAVAIRLAVAALCIVGFGSYSQRADGSTILSGSVSFDSSTSLYTYNYTLDNTYGSIGISEISILVVRQNSIGLYSAPPWPVPHTSPSGWNFNHSVGG